MAFLLAAFGRIGSSDWHALVEGLREDSLSGGRQWHERDGTVRFAVLPTCRAIFSPMRGPESPVVATVGRVEGEADPSVAVLAAYGRQGTKSLADLRGKFAYAIWDPRTRSLFVGCDAVGLLAPAYRWNGRSFLLSTRALALLSSRTVPQAWNHVYLAHALMGAWSHTAEATAFDGVQRMVGGEILRVTDRGPERITGERLVFSFPYPGDRKAVARVLGESIDRAVSRSPKRRASCVALSGGLDSCVVATALAKGQPAFDAFSLVAPPGSPGDILGLSAVVAAFPEIRHHTIQLTGDPGDLLASMPLADDPVYTGPVLQPGRMALLHAMRDVGFRHVFDGEGGDEVFDIVWGPADPLREGSIGAAIVALASHASRRRVIRDLVFGSRGPASDFFLQRLKQRVRAQRPWLRATFWESSAFTAAWSELAALGRLVSARARLPEILGAYGRYWRVQELAREAIGVEASSQFLDCEVVEFVGSVRASIAVDPLHRKVLLRRLAAQRVSTATAYRPKNEPLSDWLIARWVSHDDNVTRTVSRIKKSSLLGEFVDARLVFAAVDQARRIPGPNWLASSLVELGALVEWVTKVEERFSL